IKMMMTNIKEAENIEQLENSIRIFAPEIDRAITSVEGMINDIMEIGRTSSPSMEPVSIESIIKISLSELCMVYQNSDIHIDYQFSHKHMFNVDPLKIGRVFSNILGNVFQAVKLKREIWIKTKEYGEKMTICLNLIGETTTRLTNQTKQIIESYGNILPQENDSNQCYIGCFCRQIFLNQPCNLSSNVKKISFR
ncbi:MAG: HAMP domain-containing histidine kinase, partial [Oligoflexales bacterium]|nr:HAMP domain-containing histidine kinase [Oligoflexales bacterium]